MREELRRLLLEDVECGRRDCSTCQYNYSDDACFEHLSGLIADHLIENGVILPPCKVGDRVYSINIGDEKSLKIWIEPNGDRITQIKINRAVIILNVGGVIFICLT